MGWGQTAAPNASSDRDCGECQRGESYSGKKSGAACDPVTVFSCPAGQGFVAATLAADATCVHCFAGETWSGADNTKACEAVTVTACGLGRGLVPATVTRNGYCENCVFEHGLFSASTGGGACQQLTVCDAATQYEVQPPSAPDSSGNGVKQRECRSHRQECDCKSQYEAQPATETQDRLCLAAGQCSNGGLAACADRKYEDHCVSCNSGYELKTDSKGHKYCHAFEGTCLHGDLREPQSARRGENHCGSCDAGYKLVAHGNIHKCDPYVGECANGELVKAQSQRDGDHDCGSCHSGYYLTARDAKNQGTSSL